MRKVHIAVDIGGSSMKVTAAEFSGAVIKNVKEQTFPNNPLCLQGSLHIDIYYLFQAIQNAIGGYIAEGLLPVSIGVDTYGNGYGVLNGEGDMLGLPYFYKDSRTKGVLTAFAERIPLRKIYEETGVFPTDIRVLMQLFHEANTGSLRISQGEQVLLFPDLLGFFFTGKRKSERSMVSVASLLGRDGEWCYSAMERLGIPLRLFGEIVDGGENGSAALLPCICDELGMDSIRYVDVTTHDTESALLAAPMLKEDSVFASLGTSVVFGARTHAPVVSEESYKGRFKNMGGAFGSNSLCRDYTGLWLLEHCMNHWKKSRPDLDYGGVLGECAKGKENDSYFDVNAHAIRFYQNSLPEAIQAYCRDTGQTVPGSMGEIAKCVLESIVLEAKWSYERLRNLTHTAYRRISVVGGGVRNPLLLQMLCDALHLPLYAGSPFAATTGNVLMQLYALGAWKTTAELTEIARNSCGGEEIFPRSAGDKWERALSRLEEYKEA